MNGGNVLFTVIGFTGLYFVLGSSLFVPDWAEIFSPMARKELQPAENWRYHMIEIWYAILAFMLVMFVVLEGFDIGAGLLQYVVGKTEAERRLIIAAIGPLWSWHEVWLVGFGGTLMAGGVSKYPRRIIRGILSTPLSITVWALVLRGVSIEVSGHIADPLWRTAWHFIFVGSNLLLAILIGTALGNVLRGVPLKADGKFALAFFTNFSPRGNVGILDWFTVSVAVFMLITLAAHGATALVMKN